FVGIERLGLKFSVGRGDLEQVTANAVVGGYVHAIVVKHRRGNHRCISSPWSAPQEGAIRGDTDDAGAGELDVLSLTADLCHDHGTVSRRVLQILGSPELRAGALVQS